MSSEQTWVSPSIASPTSRFNINLRFYDVENPANYQERVRWDIGPMYERIFEDALEQANGTVLPLVYEQAVRSYIEATLKTTIAATVYIAMGAAMMQDDGIRQRLENDLYEHVAKVTHGLGLPQGAKRPLRERLKFWK